MEGVRGACVPGLLAWACSTLSSTHTHTHTRCNITSTCPSHALLLSFTKDLKLGVGKVNSVLELSESVKPFFPSPSVLRWWWSGGGVVPAGLWDFALSVQVGGLAPLSHCQTGSLGAGPTWRRGAGAELGLPQTAQAAMGGVRVRVRVHVSVRMPVCVRVCARVCVCVCVCSALRSV
uniref:Uncharacterized protein n=1 Tax=Pipistrellus kuhlii TaxID=59472 RepID=A0A7J7Y902_PIPKU|nr:hypothetical protein mPipKuh1_010255 [Pipistrellus kuhlii]